MKTILILLIGIFIEKFYSPRLSWVKESSVLLLFYSAKNIRKRLILFKI